MSRILAAGALVLAALVGACADEPTAPEPSLSHGTTSPICGPQYPQSGGVIRLDLQPATATVDYSVMKNTLIDGNVHVAIWRDWSASPGEQLYCKDTLPGTASNLTWTNTNSTVLSIFSAGYLGKAYNAKTTGTARIIVDHPSSPPDTTVITVVP
jgi:hypothetical protein